MKNGGPYNLEVEEKKFNNCSTQSLQKHRLANFKKQSVNSFVKEIQGQKLGVKHNMSIIACWFVARGFSLISSHGSHSC